MGLMGMLAKGAKAIGQRVAGGSPKAAKVVMDVKRMSVQDVRAQAWHEQRAAGDVSHCDPERTPLNRRGAYGDHLLDPDKAVEQFIKDKGLRVDRRNEKPCTSFVLSASAEWFKGDGPGGFDQEKVQAWSTASHKWLKQEFGEGVVHVSLHLDEQTPHIHAKVVPFVERTTKRGKVIRQVSHHQHPAFRGRKSYARVLDRYSEAVAHLGIERGDPMPEGAMGTHKTTRQWLAEQARALAGVGDEAKAIAAEREKIRAVAQALELDRLRLEEARREQTAQRRELLAVADELEAKERAMGRAPTPGPKAVERVRDTTPIPQREADPLPPKRVEKRARRATFRQSGAGRE